MVRKYVILAIILGGLFSGCIGEESMTGKYVSVSNNKTYFYLYEDGTFNHFFSTGESESGTYRLVDGKLIFTLVPFGNVRTFTYNGTMWIKDNGAEYVKE